MQLVVCALSWAGEDAIKTLEREGESQEFYFSHNIYEDAPPKERKNIKEAIRSHIPAAPEIW